MSQPCNKVAFVSRAEAKATANRIARKAIQPRPYWCQQCACWHLTTQTSRGKRAAPAVKRRKECLD
jgi:hypothetical protein